MSDLKTLNRRKGCIKTQLTKISKVCEDLEQLDIVDLENKIEILYKLEGKLNELRLDYYSVLEDKDVETYDAEFEDINEGLQKVKVSLKRFLNTKNSQIPDEKIVPSNNHNNEKLNIKLPEIPLPKFDGSYENWNNFKIQFGSVIDANRFLTNDQKLFYLQSSLIGNAKEIQSIDDTYDSLFNALKSRYDNKRLIVNSHMKVLLNLESISSESAQKLRTLVDCVLKHVRALRVMNIEMDIFSENLLMNIILQKVDKQTCKEFEMTLTSTELIKWDTFIAFLQDRCQVLENIQSNNYFQLKPKVIQNKIKNFVLNTDTVSCKLCKKSHALYNCENFLKMTPLKRFDTVKKLKLCINCLSDTHVVAGCKSKYTCKICKLKHNYLLHRDQAVIKETSWKHFSNSTQNLNENSENKKEEINTTEDCATSQNLFSGFIFEKRNVVLPTAIVYIKNKEGCLYKIRALLDSGSQVYAISSNTANLLGLKQHKVNLSICSLNNKTISVKREINATISNADNSYSASINLLVVPKVTGILPTTKIDISKNFKIDASISLADPEFYKPGKIDLLIGAELFFSIVKNKTIHLTNSLILKETVFGFIVSGCTQGEQNINYCGFISQLDELKESITKFWETENLDDSPSLKDEELECEKHFCETHKRDKVTGKYTVTLPIREELKLGDSYNVARARLENLLKRLDKNKEMKNLYIQFMDEYLKLGHMKQIEFSDSPKYIMPHHGVYRADSSTTKLRVVFNASSPTSNGLSLNNCLLKGGVVQEDLFSILLRFRKYKFVFVADIEKMYRQIWVNSDQCDLQCILWKEDELEDAKLFQLLTITYGTACAPFLATRVLKQLALDEKLNYPLASAAALSDFYVDDILTGADDITTALDLQHQLIQMLRSAGMELHKWSSNDKRLLEHVSLNQRDYDFDEAKNNSVKTLGLRWDPQKEHFFFNVFINSDKPTKRSVLSEISRLFDPLGLLGPVITQAKLFLQTLWKLNLDWNQEIPTPEREKWENFRKKLLEIKYVFIPRFILIDNFHIIELHGFCDASREAYGAVVYVRSLNSTGEIKVSLLCSKSRVSPLKEITIPRLELCGAVLLTNLVKKTIDSLKMPVDHLYYWSDSKIVLAWILKPLSHLKLFVKNRVSVIQNLTDLKCWNHVNSKENPADLISRGLQPDKISNCELWWHGPSFLRDNQELEPPSSEPIEDIDLYMKELKESEPVAAFVQKQDTFDLINNCSSFTKLQRVTAWCLRFIKNARYPQNKRSGSLSSEELADALTTLIKIVQEISFPDEVSCFKKKQCISKNSKILTLCPFMDTLGLIRVGGRLHNSPFNFNGKNPILLPNNCNFTHILINHYHFLYFHIGPEGTLSFIRNNFWILKGRNCVRKIVKNCIICRKVSSKSVQQQMADLPPARVVPARVFSKVGIDFAGPFVVKTFAGRVKKLHKCYVSIFICLVVKAVHFEIVHNLTTEAFIGALKRFIARRNRPVEIFSDNASNFVGANNELVKIIKELFKTTSKNKIEDFASKEGIKWNFNPPLAPHFGGLWEAGVKSLKHHLKRIIGNTVMTHEEFLTLVTQIEAILNSRPLTPLSNDPNDLTALTPAHFLVGSSLAALPDRDFSETPMNRITRWQLVEKFNQILWKRWTNEYLNRLQQRPKSWSKGQVLFKEGDLILVKNTENFGYLKWHLARIVKLHPGRDNIVRVVTIKDKTGIHKRAVSSIAALPYVN